MERTGTPNLWRKIAQIQIIALCITCAAAMVLNLVIAAIHLGLQSMLFGGADRPATNLFFWPILFAASPVFVMIALQRCFRFWRALTFVMCGAVIAGLLGLLCGLGEAQFAATPLISPLEATELSAAGYMIAGTFGLLCTAWVAEEEAASSRRFRRGRPDKLRG